MSGDGPSPVNSWLFAEDRWRSQTFTLKTPVTESVSDMRCYANNSSDIPPTTQLALTCPFHGRKLVRE